MPAPQNPYEPPHAFGASDDLYSHRERERELRLVEGLTLPRLDRLVRESQVDAARHATLEAEAASERTIERIHFEKFPRIYDEGYDAGILAGSSGAAAALTPYLRSVVDALVPLADFDPGGALGTTDEFEKLRQSVEKVAAAAGNIAASG